MPFKTFVQSRCAHLSVLLGVVPGAGLISPQATAAQTSRVTIGEVRVMTPRQKLLPEVPGGFTFCRLRYVRTRREQRGQGWRTDYPNGDRNLTTRLSQLTPTPISGWLDGRPGFAVPASDRSRAVPLPIPVLLGRRYRDFQRRRGREAEGVHSQRRVPLGRRLLGEPGVVALGQSDPAGLPRISDRGSLAGAPSLLDRLPGG